MLEGFKKNILGNLMVQETLFGWIITGPLPALHSKKIFTYASGYVRKEVSGKFKTIVKPDYREHELLANGPRPHSDKIDSPFHRNTASI